MTVIHVDMDAFFAAVEIRDNPELAGRPLIIGALPGERGVVATASYDARKYGVHSAMNIKEAYRLCPDGVYIHPDHGRYKAVSDQLHDLWSEYCLTVEYVALDEAYLDVSDRSFEDARKTALAIKRRTFNEFGLTCSVGLAYSKAAAKTASEEKKPDGYFEIPSADDFVSLIIDRDVGVLYSVGIKTAEKLRGIGINTVRDIRDNRETVSALFGRQGKAVCDLAFGVDNRPIVPYDPQDAKSVGRELTFQEDVTDYEYLRHVLLLLSIAVSRSLSKLGLRGGGVTLKATYYDMRNITRSKSISGSDSAIDIYRTAVPLLGMIEKRPLRLIGVSVHGLTKGESAQITFESMNESVKRLKELEAESELLKLKPVYGLDFTGNIDKIFKGETLYKTVEYMRRKRSKTKQ